MKKKLLNKKKISRRLVFKTLTSYKDDYQSIRTWSKISNQFNAIIMINYEKKATEFEKKKKKNQ